MDGGRHPAPSGARIGPNAILQTIAVLDQVESRALRDRVMLLAHVDAPSPEAGMLPEADCAAVHRALRLVLPKRAGALLRLSGLATGDYILRHRIPRPVQWALRLMPRPLAARLLARAIMRHAWTFAGSGQFRVVVGAPLNFEIYGNPLIAGEQAPHPVCHWHAAVFERLYARLVWPDVRVTELSCLAQGATCCRFQVLPYDPPAPNGPFHLGKNTPG